MSKFDTQHWSLRRRLYVIAVTAGFCTLLSLAANFFTTHEYGKSVDHISNSELAKLYQIAHTFQELSDIHTEVFSLLRFGRRKGDEQQIYLLGSKLLDRMDKLHAKLLAGQKTQILDRQGNPYQFIFENIAIELRVYRNAASVSIEMLTVNSALSEKYMLKAASSFNQLNKLLSLEMAEVTDHTQHEMKEEVELINSIYWPLNVLVFVVALLMAPLLLKLIRDLNASFHWIETTLNQLREGHVAVEIPPGKEDSEMGRVYHALEQFRTALINLRESETALSDKHRLLLEESERRLLTDKELRRSLVELSRAIDAAEASNKAKSLFLANMSHEVRTPLNAVLGMAQLLQTTQLNVLQRDYIDTIYTQGQHLLQLLDRVLDFSKMEAGNFKLHYQAFKLDLLLEEVTDLFKKESHDKDIRLTVEVEPIVSNQLYGDPLRLRQILINLLSNAYKFTEQGEIRLRVADAAMTSECRLIKQRQCPNSSAAGLCGWHALYIAVSDTGIGIEKNKHRYIFDNFTQADESYTRKYGGTGIGLAICKQLVELMDGEIGVESEPGRGSTFWFRICLPDENHIEQQQRA